MTKRTATAEIRKTETGYVAVTQVGRVTSTYPLANDPADARAYADYFRTTAETAGFEATIRIDI